MLVYHEVNIYRISIAPWIGSGGTVPLRNEGTDSGSRSARIVASISSQVASFNGEKPRGTILK
jgi:hypothetical protein